MTQNKPHSCAKGYLKNKELKNHPRGGARFQNDTHLRD
jgi:hypothetical protein